MSKLASVAKSALKTRVRVNPLNPTRILPSCRGFSTGESGESQQQDSSSSTTDPFLQSPEGVVFGRVTLSSKNLLKTDIIHFFEGCNLSSADVKVEYTRAYNPTAMLLQFPSQSAFDLAFKHTVRKGRLYKLDRVDRSQWELLTSYDGKSVLLQGIPRNAFPEDIERFLSGSNYDPNFQIFVRPISSNDIMKCAIVRYPTSTDAMCAFVTKNNGFCLNSPVTMRVLQ